jgi:2-polyprenyl-3-methyl-5-hydroxy-6-metoxy-1,4-benzoquinol methylase
MMRKNQAEAITKKIGSLDGPRLIEKLNSLGVGENLELIDIGIRIPKAFVPNISNLQAELSVFSKTGRSFELSEEGEYVVINIMKMKQSRLPEYSGFPRSSGRYSSVNKQKIDLWGVLEQNVQLPSIPRGSKVLDVGAGSGFIAEKIKDTLGCDVYALEPSFERSIDYDTCVKRLGEDHVEKLTLQEALQRNSEKYFQAFDIVTVFKYNVPYRYKDDFLNALAKTVKPDGVVYITSVEPERFYREPGEDALYLTEAVKKYFGEVKIIERNSSHGSDGLMTCVEPKPVLEKKIDLKK